MPGLTEGQLLSGRDTPHEVADFYLQRGARNVVIKLGSQGAYYASGSERGVVAGMPVAKVVDTVGAGDGFAVGVISGLLKGLGLPEATAWGNAIGARVVQFPGDSDGLPTLSELQGFMAANHA
jgi:sugar/nucleoside kinase (ribokinase family)